MNDYYVTAAYNEVGLIALLLSIVFVVFLNVLYEYSSEKAWKKEFLSYFSKPIKKTEVTVKDMNNVSIKWGSD